MVSTTSTFSSVLLWIRHCCLRFSGLGKICRILSPFTMGQSPVVLARVSAGYQQYCIHPDSPRLLGPSSTHKHHYSKFVAIIVTSTADEHIRWIQILQYKSNPNTNTIYNTQSILYNEIHSWIFHNMVYVRKPIHPQYMAYCPQTTCCNSTSHAQYQIETSHTLSIKHIYYNGHSINYIHYMYTHTQSAKACILTACIQFLHK